MLILPHTELSQKHDVLVECVRAGGMDAERGPREATGAFRDVTADSLG